VALADALHAFKPVNALLEATSTGAYRKSMASLSALQVPPLYTTRVKNFALLLLAMTQFVVGSTLRW
jgi:hypothetical protein